MLMNPFPHNQNMNLRTHDQSGVDQDPSESSGHGFINIVRDMKVVTRVKDYGSSQPDLGKELLSLRLFHLFIFNFLIVFCFVLHLMID